MTRDAVPGAQPLEQHLGVRLPHAPQQQLAGVGAALQPHGRVLGDQPGQRRRQPVLVGAGGGLDARRAAAGWAGPTAAPGAGPPARTACRRSPRWPSRATAQMSPAGQAATGRSVRAQRRGDRADPLVDVVVGVAAVGHAVPGDVDRDVGPQRAGEDADQGDPARGRGRSSSSRPRRPAGPSGSQASDGAGEPSGRVTGGQPCSMGHGKAGDEQLEQLVDADAGQRGGAEHRVEVPAGDRGLQVGDEVGLRPARRRRGSAP